MVSRGRSLIGRAGVLIADLPQSYPSSRAKATLTKVEKTQCIRAEITKAVVNPTSGQSGRGLNLRYREGIYTEFAKQQATVMTEQTELVIRLQQQAGASASHQAPLPPRVPIPEEMPNIQNIQEDTDIPTGPPPPPTLLQLSKAPKPINVPDSPFEFEVDPTALKLSKLEKMFKKSQGVKTIPDIEDGYTDAAVTLPDRFKMPHINRFDGSGDPMVWRPSGTQSWKMMLKGTGMRWPRRSLHRTHITRKLRLQPVISRRQDLHEMGVQIEDALKQGLIDNDKEQPRRTFNRNTNVGPSDTTTTRASEVSMVTTIPPPRTMAATPFSGASGSNTQTAKYPPKNQRTFAPLYMPLSKALGVLIRKGHLKPLEPRPLPEKLSPTHNPAKYYAFHQQHGHDTDQCFRLRHEIQDLIHNGVIVPPEKSNVTTNPLPPHHQAPPPKKINFIQTGVVFYDPSIYITPSHLPRPEVLLPDCTDLCMLDISKTQPEPTVVTVEDRTWEISEENGIVESESRNLRVLLRRYTVRVTSFCQ
ncbi:hypothetical protein HYC85_029398 [Camellia sinensis]|uniref:Uncharacterized protein n=1 Tax=Camellia sinensis TaxID=4442 RepID=A0A7J7FYJ7_CAMSI|nr:hypothetical protein HYC85_029398 [Camellia sinensis]